ncbi:hypothetical protein KBC04_02870 [Candidatus Babeliales bacterium]|nr:hypothetical protein [Candidatus Babeliales bacterium]MBP9844004.1 hypothetical protein [Candidatus Babeliales bacterium]
MKYIKYLLTVLFFIAGVAQLESCAKGMHKNKKGICVLKKKVGCAKGMHKNKEGICVIKGKVQRIHIKNEYGREISAQLEWKQRKAPHATFSSAVQIPKGHHDTFKGPFVGYKIHKLTITPTAEAAAVGAAIAVGSVALIAGTAGAGASAPAVGGGVAEGAAAGAVFNPMTAGLVGTEVAAGAGAGGAVLGTTIGGTAGLGGAVVGGATGTTVLAGTAAAGGGATTNIENEKEEKTSTSTGPAVQAQGGTVSQKAKADSGAAAAAGVGSFGMSAFQGTTLAFGNTYFVVKSAKRIKGTVTKGLEIVGFKNQTEYKMFNRAELANRTKEAYDDAVTKKLDVVTIAGLKIKYEDALLDYNAYHNQANVTKTKAAYDKAVAKKLDATTIANLKLAYDKAVQSFSVADQEYIKNKSAAKK